MSRKMIVTLELDIVDLSEEDRKECADGMGIDESDEEYLEDMPYVADLSESELNLALLTFFESVSDSELQSFAWEGSDYFMNVANIKLRDAKLYDPDKHKVIPLLVVEMGDLTT